MSFMSNHRLTIGISVFALIFSNIAIWAFNDIFVKFAEIKLWQIHSEKFFFFVIRTYFWINVLYFLSYQLVIFGSLLWLYRKIRNKEFVNSVKAATVFCTSKETVVLALILQIICFMFLMPALFPFFPLGLFVITALVCAVLTTVNHHYRLKNTIR